MPVLQQQCRNVSFLQDSDLLSKGGYVVQQTQLWWSLKFLHERFQDKGDTRAFYKWLQFFLHGVRETKCLSHANDDEWIHCRKAQQSDSELQETVARSVAILAFLGFCLRDSRTKL